MSVILVNIVACACHYRRVDSLGHLTVPKEESSQFALVQTIVGSSFVSFGSMSSRKSMLYPAVDGQLIDFS